MNEYFLGIDASKGYADFVLLDSKKIIVEILTILAILSCDLGFIITV